MKWAYRIVDQPGWPMGTYELLTPEGEEYALTDLEEARSFCKRWNNLMGKPKK